MLNRDILNRHLDALRKKPLASNAFSQFYMQKMQHAADPTCQSEVPLVLKKETLSASRSGKIIEFELDKEKKTAIELSTNQKYFASNKAELNWSDEKRAHDKLHVSQQTSIELAVAGGNILRLYLGDHQPYCYAAKASTPTSNGVPLWFRLSSAVEMDQRFYINEQWPESYIGPTAAFLISYFFGDNDFKNIGTLKKEDGDIVIRFDSEAFFGDAMLENDEVEEHITYGCSPCPEDLMPKEKLDNEESERSDESSEDEDEEQEDKHLEEEHPYIFGKQVPEFFTGMFALDCLNYKQMFCSKAFIDYFTSSPKRINEAWATLARIITVPLEPAFAILDQTVSDTTVREQAKRALAERKQSFTLAAEKIIGFSEYLHNKEYLMSDLYHSYGLTEMDSSLKISPKRSLDSDLEEEPSKKSKIMRVANHPASKFHKNANAMTVKEDLSCTNKVDLKSI